VWNLQCNDCHVSVLQGNYMMNFFPMSYNIYVQSFSNEEVIYSSLPRGSNFIIPCTFLPITSPWNCMVLDCTWHKDIFQWWELLVYYEIILYKTCEWRRYIEKYPLCQVQSRTIQFRTCIGKKSTWNDEILPLWVVDEYITSSFEMIEHKYYTTLERKLSYIAWEPIHDSHCTAISHLLWSFLLYISWKYPCILFIFVLISTRYFFAGVGWLFKGLHFPQ